LLKWKKELIFFGKLFVANKEKAAFFSEKAAFSCSCQRGFIAPTQ
jgi:hypothetical protein